MVSRLHRQRVHSHDLRRFRYHTGAEPKRMARDEPCPPLFRDLGFEAMARFLRGELQRLCGPLSPITYMSSASYVEPYTDYGQIGRLMLLAPQTITPWHSGVEAVFIGPREIKIDYENMIFIPSEIPATIAAGQLSDVQTFREAADVIGIHYYQEAKAETILRLDHLITTHAETERVAGPLRRRFQSSSLRERDDAREWMMRVGLIESDICTAWHHLSDQRREFIHRALCELGETMSC